ncbi:MAG TPA: hypothetical protein QF469_07995 [Sphingomonas sanguinis]|uniref:hypothetical protein n=1 Tax=Sphingomonas sanguinis TaxID=33051 RepID=UPI002AC05756|nr:hypothetical protein [Sphingomonas sanguinis]
MTHPSPGTLQAMRAFLGGYLDEGGLTSIALEKAIEVLKPVTPPGITVDGMIVSRLLRRLKFQRSYLPQDRGTIIYRKVD